MPSLFFSVGEPSGDLHAANLMRAIQQQWNASPRVDRGPIEFRGFGGPLMSQAGCNIDFELTNLAVVGFAEVVPKLRQFFRVADRASAIFRESRPDAVILVDFPGFNWHIAKRAKALGIPVAYYLPPQLWAWGSWRITKMRKYVDHVLCGLPFEPEWYHARGMQVDYVGHPFFDEVLERRLDAAFITRWSRWNGVQVAVLPGSRSREVQNIWPLQLEMIRNLSRSHPNTRFLVACYRDRHCVDCRQQLTPEDRELNIEFFVGRTSEIIHLADCGLVKSGSVSLELMARGTPSVIVYHVSRSLYCIGRCLVGLKSMTLPNMMAKETIMPEYLAVGNNRREIQAATESMRTLIDSPESRQRQREQLNRLACQYGAAGASHRAAEKILEQLGGSNFRVGPIDRNTYAA